MERAIAIFLMCFTAVLIFGGFFYGGIFEQDKDKNAGDALRYQQQEKQNYYQNHHQIGTRE